jgi:hypothetical protein
MEEQLITNNTSSNDVIQTIEQTVEKNIDNLIQDKDIIETKVNNYSDNVLVYIKTTIEKMNKVNQIKVLNILNNCDLITLNENTSGNHINLSQINNNEIIQELLDFIIYVNKQEVVLLDGEQQKENFKNNYFVKDNKD